MKNKYGDSHIDLTDEFEVYEKGKTVECECGQGFGLEFDVRSKTCPSCGKVIIDEKYDEREPCDEKEKQSTLGDWT